MSTFIRITDKDGAASVIDACEGTCVRVLPGGEVELLGLERSMVTIEPFGGRLYVSVFPTGGFEMAGARDAFASDRPPTLIFEAENGSARRVATNDEFEKLLYERAANGPPVQPTVPPVPPHRTELALDLPRPWAA